MGYYIAAFHNLIVIQWATRYFYYGVMTASSYLLSLQRLGSKKSWSQWRPHFGTDLDVKCSIASPNLWRNDLSGSDFSSGSWVVGWRQNHSPSAAAESESVEFGVGTQSAGALLLSSWSHPILGVNRKNCQWSTPWSANWMTAPETVEQVI